MKIFPKSQRSLPLIGALLAAGQVVATPTETAYGLLADATNPKAVARVVKIKGREPGKPIALLVADIKTARKYFRITNVELKIMNKFWPGPLTLLLQPKIKFSRSIVGPGGWVGVRVPGNAWLRSLLFSYKLPLTATSANKSGGTTPYSVASMIKLLKPRGLKYVLDGGNLIKRPTSTIIQVKTGRLVFVRIGAISRGRLESVIK